MNVNRNHFIFALLCMAGLIYPVHISAQNMINNGGNIVVEQGGYIVISDDYINRNDGQFDGIVDLDGTIILRKNWINQANNFVIPEPVDSVWGEVIMNGDITQYIDGITATHFKNLTLHDADKVLHVTNCKISGRLTLNAVLKLNTNRLIIDNPSPDAITCISKYILSETSSHKGYGEIQWNISDRTSTYLLPFGSGLSDLCDLNLTLTTKTPGDIGGAISFATYPTECNNEPLPEFVNDLDRNGRYIADRFWIIDPKFNLRRPDIDITFRYTDNDINDACNSRIDEPGLKAIRYNTFSNLWTDMQPQGVDNPDENTLTVKDIPSSDFYAPWTLANEVIDWKLYMPDAFTPNGDGDNDLFGPVGTDLDIFTDYNFYIYDRWGSLIFHSITFDDLWNGNATEDNKPCQEGIYVWFLALTDKYGTSLNYKYGTVMLLR
jgi:gliding motility-associated-like protein